MAAYYNEFDPGAAAWLRELIKRDLIADGEVDERSILDVTAEDLTDFTQCHFFAGIGGWSYALRLAGFSDDKPIWTGSPPCQPFSIAGQQKGEDDERHLAPHFANLVANGRPPILFGEQVASSAVFGKVARKAGSQSEAEPEWAWIDDLQDRLEAAHYAVGSSDIPAAGVGAPHIRQRTFFGAIRLAYTKGAGAGNDIGGIRSLHERHGETSGVADAGIIGQSGQGEMGRPSDSASCSDRKEHRAFDAGGCHAKRPCPLNEFWRDADWIFCRDGKWRPVEPGTFPLAHGIPARVGRLRGYGNAIVPQVAAAFIESFFDSV